MPYPLKLDIRPFIDIETTSGDENAYMYDLYGTVVHFGHSTHGGHY